MGKSQQSQDGSVAAYLGASSECVNMLRGVLPYIEALLLALGTKPVLCMLGKLAATEGKATTGLLGGTTQYFMGNPSR